MTDLNIIKQNIFKRIVSIKILGYDEQGNEYDFSNVISDETDSSLSQDIEDWRHEDNG